MAYNRYQDFKANPVWAMILINFLVFIATLINRGLIISAFGLQPAGFTAHPWTIITSMFVHGGFLHILFNMISFYFLGTYLCRIVGENKFLIVYFGGGILGGIFYILLAFPLSIAVGASGAIFALGGALAVMRPKIQVMVFPIPSPIPLWIAVIGGFIIFSFLSFIAWQAHLGGLVFGLVAGYFFKKRYFF
jgi:membrane associated rhomboid family serine protease